jgi:hypothetical protein
VEQSDDCPLWHDLPITHNSFHGNSVQETYCKIYAQYETNGFKPMFCSITAAMLSQSHTENQTKAA